MSLNPQRTAACLSDLVLDRHVSEEAALDQQAQTHLRTCLRCLERLARFQAAHREFALGSLAAHSGSGSGAEVVAEPAVAEDTANSSGPRVARALPQDARTRGGFAPVAVLPVAASPQRKRGGLYALGAAAVAALALLALRPESDTVRTKGSAQLGFFVKRGERVFEGADGAVLAPGDELRFRYSTSSPSWLAILGSDAAQNVSVYFPAGGRMAQVPAGEGQLLPEATQLDESLGREQILGVFCDHETALATLTGSAAPSGCTVHTLHVTKQVSP